VARYGYLSDGSLQFVKVLMPNGKEYTLPSLVSASGARFTDEHECYGEVLVILPWLKKEILKESG